MISPRLAKTAPTMGLGDVSHFARLAKRNASHMHCSSKFKK